MAIEALLQFKNADSTENINSRLAGLVPKGVLKGGVVVAEPAGLQVRIKGTKGEPWVLLAFAQDGMLIRERAEEHVVPVVAGITNVIALRAKYLGSGSPLAHIEVMALGAYQNDPDKSSLIRLASVTPKNGATSVAPEEIDLSFRDAIEGFSRRILRDVVATRADLPAVSGFPSTAEINFLNNNFIANSSVTISTGLVTETYPIVKPISFDLASVANVGLSRVNPSQKELVSVTEQSFTGVVTVISTTPHNLIVNDRIRLSDVSGGINNSGLRANGNWVVDTVLDAVTFTFRKIGSTTPFAGVGGNVIHRYAICIVTATVAPGVIHDLVVTTNISIAGAVNIDFNVTAVVTSVIDERQFTYEMSGFPTGISGFGSVTKSDASLPPNSIAIGQTETLTAKNFESSFKNSSLANILKVFAIGSSLQLEVLAAGDFGNTYTISKQEPGIVVGTDRIVLSGPTFSGGVNPLTSSQATSDLRAGDVFVVLFGDIGTLELWGYDGIKFQNLTSASTTTLLDFHRRNLLANEKHLTENEKSALIGTVGVPSATNRFVTQQDTSVLTATIASALQGADEEIPSGNNKYLTESRYRGETAKIDIPANQDWVKLPVNERWVVGSESDSALQFFNVVLNTTLKSAGGPTEYTQQDFTPLKAATFYDAAPTSSVGGVGIFNPITLFNPANPSKGADAKGIFPRLDAAVLGNPLELWVKLTNIPNNGTATLLYTKAAKEKVRLTTADNLAGPQRIIPASLKEIENKTSELRFNSGVAVSGTTITFPPELFVSTNLQNIKFRRTVGGKILSLESTFNLNLGASSGTVGIVNPYTRASFSAANLWTRYFFAVTRSGKINTYHLGNLLEKATDVAYSSSVGGLSQPSLALTNGDWIFASVAVQADASNVSVQSLVSSNIELYPFQGTNSKESGSVIVVGDNTTSFGHFSGADGHKRALAFAQAGDTLRILPGTYTGQCKVEKNNITMECVTGAVFSHNISEYSAAFTNVTTNAITVVGHLLKANDLVTVSSTADMPSGLSSSLRYYVRDVTTDTFKLSQTPGGTSVNITTSGTGTRTVELVTLALSVLGANFKLKNASFANCSIGINVSTLATNIMVQDPEFAASTARNFIAATSLVKPNLIFRYSTVATWTCTSGSVGTFIGDFNSSNALNDALAAANSGDIILVYPGTYDRVTNWTKSNIQIKGFGSGRVFVSGGGSNTAITVSGVGNVFENLVLIDASVGIDCIAGSSYNTFSETVKFESTVVIPIKFPQTAGNKHFNHHPMFSGNVIVSGSHLNKTSYEITCGDGVSSWGDYVGREAINDAITAETSGGAKIKVARGTYNAIDKSFSNTTIEGAGKTTVIQGTFLRSETVEQACIKIDGNNNIIKNVHLESLNNLETTWGIHVAGTENYFSGISFTDLGANKIAAHKKYKARTGSGNRFLPHVGAPTGPLSFTVGDGRRSFGDHVGLGAIQSAINSLPVSPSSSLGSISNVSGDECDFQDFSNPIIVDFTDGNNPFYVQMLNRYITITVGVNQGSWKVVSVPGPQTVRLKRYDGGSFTAGSDVLWKAVAGVKISVLPGHYSAFTLSASDVDLESWGGGSDVIINAISANPCITITGSRNRISGFRLENSFASGVGISVSGRDNIFEKNKFTADTRYVISSAATGNQMLDSPEGVDRIAYTVSAYPSRADFVGTTDVTIQTAINAAASDPHLKTVFIGAGVYTLSSTLQVPDGVSIRGAGYETNLAGNVITDAMNLAGHNAVTNIRFTNISTAFIGSTSDSFLFGNWAPAIVPPPVPLAPVQYNKIVGTAPGDFSSITAALLTSASGDAILVRDSYTITSPEEVNVAGILITFMPGFEITIDGGTTGLKINANNVTVERPNYKIDTAISVNSALHIVGNDCEVSGAKVQVDNSGATLTDAYKIDAVAKRAFLRGSVIWVAGTVTNLLTDDGSNSDASIRGYNS